MFVPILKVSPLMDKLFFVCAFVCLCVCALFSFLFVDLLLYFFAPSPPIIFLPYCFCYRYFKILTGEQPELVRSLGASDSVMCMVGVWYFVFPRTPIHLFRTAALITRVLKNAPATRKLAAVIENINPTFSSLFFLPFLFTQDLLESFYLLPGHSLEISNLALSSSVNHSAHAGGMVAAAIFHLCVSGPLKYKTFAFSVREVVGRLVKMITYVSLISFGIFSQCELGLQTFRVGFASFQMSDLKDCSKHKSNPGILTEEQSVSSMPSGSRKEMVTKVLLEDSMLDVMNKANQCTEREAFHMVLRLRQLDQDATVEPEINAVWLRSQPLRTRLRYGLGMVGKAKKSSPSDDGNDDDDNNGDLDANHNNTVITLTPSADYDNTVIALPPSAHNLRYGECDHYYSKMRSMMEELHPQVVEAVMSRIHLKEMHHERKRGIGGEGDE